jgi:2-dehydro-3-deoxy-D-gluconate 5-dehydrogenase
LVYTVEHFAGHCGIGRLALDMPVSVVTGASRGLGQAIALDLARRGYDLGLIQRGDAAETAAGVQALGRRVHVVQADLSQVASAAPAVAEAARALGGLDALVANAGRVNRKPALDLTPEEVETVLTINLRSVFAMCQAAARRFLADGTAGRMVMTASVLSFQGGFNVSAYAASKAGVANLARALCNEWAPLGLRVNAVTPGYVHTQQTDDIHRDPERFAAITGRIPMGRWGRAEEIANAVAWLLSDDASYVNGHVLAVDGGWLAR